jgi:2-methylcitrate dehydratase PrpD
MSTLMAFCSVKQSVVAVEALQKILRSGIDAPSIAAVRVRVPPAYAAMIGQKAQAGVRTSTLVSAARQLAFLACAPARLYDVDRGEAVTDPAILGFEAKVEIVADAALTQYYPRSWPAEVEVTTADGTTLRERVIEAAGDPGRPLGDEALDDKAHSVLDRLIGRDAAGRLIGIGRRGFEDEPGCRALAGAFLACFAAA